MSLSDAAWAQQDRVLAAVDVIASGEIQDEHLVEAWDGLEVEALELFDDGEAACLMRRSTRRRSRSIISISTSRPGTAHGPGRLSRTGAPISRIRAGGWVASASSEGIIYEKSQFQGRPNAILKTTANVLVPRRHFNRVDAFAVAALPSPRTHSPSSPALRSSSSIYWTLFGVCA